MAGWMYPIDFRKDSIIDDLTDSELIYYHDNLHIIWKKISEGFDVDFPESWTFLEVYNFHERIVNELLKRGLPHLFPINELDQIMTTQIIIPSENEEKIEPEEGISLN